MSRATGYLVDGNIYCSLTNGDTIVSSFNDGSGDFHISRPTYMHSISVWTISRRSYAESICPKQIAISNVHVESHGVYYIDRLHFGVCHFGEIQRLHKTQTLQLIQFSYQETSYSLHNTRQYKR